MLYVSKTPRTSELTNRIYVEIFHHNDGVFFISSNSTRRLKLSLKRKNIMFEIISRFSSTIGLLTRQKLMIVYQLSHNRLKF